MGIDRGQLVSKVPVPSCVGCAGCIPCTVYCAQVSPSLLLCFLGQLGWQVRPGRRAGQGNRASRPGGQASRQAVLVAGLQVFQDFQGSPPCLRCQGVCRGIAVQGQPPTTRTVPCVHMIQFHSAPLRFRCVCRSKPPTTNKSFSYGSVHTTCGLPAVHRYVSYPIWNTIPLKALCSPESYFVSGYKPVLPTPCTVYSCRSTLRGGGRSANVVRFSGTKRGGHQIWLHPIDRHAGCRSPCLTPGVKLFVNPGPCRDS